MSQTTAATPKAEIPWSIHSRGFAYKRRCKGLPRPSEAEIVRMVADFHQRGGQVQQIAPAFAIATHNAARTA